MDQNRTATSPSQLPSARQSCGHRSDHRDSSIKTASATPISGGNAHQQTQRQNSPSPPDLIIGPVSNAMPGLPGHSPSREMSRLGETQPGRQSDQNQGQWFMFPMPVYQPHLTGLSYSRHMRLLSTEPSYHPPRPHPPTPTVEPPPRRVITSLSIRSSISSTVRTSPDSSSHRRVRTTRVRADRSRHAGGHDQNMTRSYGDQE